MASDTLPSPPPDPPEAAAVVTAMADLRAAGLLAGHLGDSPKVLAILSRLAEAVLDGERAAPYVPALPTPLEIPETPEALAKRLVPGVGAFVGMSYEQLVPLIEDIRQEAAEIVGRRDEQVRRTAFFAAQATVLLSAAERAEVSSADYAALVGSAKSELDLERFSGARDAYKTFAARLRGVLGVVTRRAQETKNRPTFVSKSGR